MGPCLETLQHAVGHSNRIDVLDAEVETDHCSNMYLLLNIYTSY